MGLYDFLLLANDKKDWTDLLKGTYTISLGDTLFSFLGSGLQQHVVGDQVVYVFDYEALLGKIPVLGEFLESLPMELILGAGGNIAYNLGRNTSLTYIGPEVEIKRTGSVKATSQNNFFGTVKAPAGGIGPAASPEDRAKSTIDTTTGVICGLLVMAMVLVNTGIEIAMRIKYQQKASDGDDEAIEKIATYCTADLWLTTRVMALIKAIEVCAASARNATSEFFDAQNKLKTATFGLAVCGLDPAAQTAIKDWLEKAAHAVADFIKKNAVILICVSFFVVAAAAIAGTLAYTMSQNKNNSGGGGDSGSGGGDGGNSNSDSGTGN